MYLSNPIPRFFQTTQENFAPIFDSRLSKWADEGAVLGGNATALVGSLIAQLAAMPAVVLITASGGNAEDCLRNAHNTGYTSTYFVGYFAGKVVGAAAASVVNIACYTTSTLAQMASSMFSTATAALPSVHEGAVLGGNATALVGSLIAQLVASPAAFVITASGGDATNCLREAHNIGQRTTYCVGYLGGGAAALVVNTACYTISALVQMASSMFSAATAAAS